MRTLSNPDPAPTVTIPEARAMHAAAAIASATVRPQPAQDDTWEVVLDLRNGRPCALRAQRGAAGVPRSFARIETALNAVREVGLTRATVEFSQSGEAREAGEAA